MVSSVNKFSIKSVLYCFLWCSLTPAVVFAQGERAGTHLDSNAVHSTVLELHQSDEIEAMREHLEQGR